MSGMAGAWHNDKFFSLGVFSGIVESIAAPPGEDPSEHTARYFAGANVPYQEWLDDKLPALKLATAKLVESNLLLPVNSSGGKEILLKHNLSVSSFGEVEFRLRAWSALPEECVDELQTILESR